MNKAQALADAIAAIVDTYEGSYVSTGRTLAEVINLPATLLFKMSFISGILDHSEGPPAESSKLVYQSLVEEAAAADANYQSSIEPAMKKFSKLVKP